jgi:CheY-like chemotaxis protein
VTVGARQVGGDAEITVTDTGVGIPAEDHARIFESFQQAGRSPSTQEGTGLGLTLSRRIVELHGGHMWLVSEVGRGSTFGFTIPSATPAGSALPENDGGPDAPIVLVVEDDRRSQELMAILLQDQGLTVEVAATGEQALDRLRERLPSAVVLDIRLPGIDGWEVLSRVRGNPRTARLPVLVVSILDERARALALGADDYLVKPVDRDLLVGALRRAALLPGGFDVG